MSETTYTVTTVTVEPDENEDEPEAIVGRGLSLEQAALVVLQYDGATFSIRPEPGAWRLWHGDGKILALGDPAYRAEVPTRFVSTAQDESAARDEIFAWVIEESDSLSGLDVLSDAEHADIHAFEIPRDRPRPDPPRPQLRLVGGSDFSPD